NLRLVMRHLSGIGTPRGLQDRPATVMAALLVLLGATRRWLIAISAWHPLIAAVRCFRHRSPPRATPQRRPLTPRAAKRLADMLGMLARTFGITFPPFRVLQDD